MFKWYIYGQVTFINNMSIATTLLVKVKWINKIRALVFLYSLGVLNNVLWFIFCINIGTLIIYSEFVFASIHFFTTSANNGEMHCLWSKSRSTQYCMSIQKCFKRRNGHNYATFLVLYSLQMVCSGCVLMKVITSSSCNYIFYRCDFVFGCIEVTTVVSGRNYYLYPDIEIPT